MPASFPVRLHQRFRPALSPKEPDTAMHMEGRSSSRAGFGLDQAINAITSDARDEPTRGGSRQSENRYAEHGYAEHVARAARRCAPGASSAASLLDEARRIKEAVRSKLRFRNQRQR